MKKDSDYLTCQPAIRVSNIRYMCIDKEVPPGKIKRKDIDTQVQLRAWVGNRKKLKPWFQMV